MYPPTTESQRTGWALSEVGGWLAGVNRVAHARSARVPRSHPEADGLPVFAAKPRGIGHISYVWAALLKTTPVVRSGVIPTAPRVTPSEAQVDVQLHDLV